MTIRLGWRFAVLALYALLVTIAVGFVLIDRESLQWYSANPDRVEELEYRVLQVQLQADELERENSNLTILVRDLQERTVDPEMAEIARAVNPDPQMSRLADLVAGSWALQLARSQGLSDASRNALHERCMQWILRGGDFSTECQ